MSDAPAVLPSSIDSPPVSRRRIAINFLALAATNVLGLLVTILVSVWVRRAMGPEAVGQVSWAVAAVAYLTGLVSPGLLPVGQRAIARAPERTQPFVALVITVQTALAGLVYAVLLFMAWLEPRGATVSQLLVIQGLTLFLTAWNTGWVLQGHERMAAPGLAALGLNLLQLPVLVLMVHGPQDVAMYAAITVACTAGTVGFNLWYLARCRILRPLRLRPTMGGWRQALREAAPLGLSQAAVLLIANTGILLLGFTHGDDAVGQFASAYRLMLVANVVTASLWNAYFPAFARADRDTALAVRLSREYLRLLAWIGLPVAALGFTFGGHIVELLYGPAFIMAGRYFEVLCLSVGFNFLNYGVTSALVPWGHGRLQLRLIGAAALLNLAVSAIGIPLFGAWAAVGATLVSEALLLALGIAARRRSGLFWHPVLPVIMAPLACSAGVVVLSAVVPRKFDGLWWMELAVATLAVGGVMLAFERHAVAQLGRSLRGR